MKLNFQEIEKTDKLEIFSDGEETVGYFNNLLSLLNRIGDCEKTLQPVSLLLLDINMPLVNGIDALKEIKEMY